MKFIILTLGNDTPIALNPRQIRGVYPVTSGRHAACVDMGGSEDYYVQEEITDILDKVSEAVGK